MPELIGRDLPAATVRGAIERAHAGHGGLVLVAGEAGIGKSALVAEAAGAARRTGALVAAGACWDRDGTPGYWPWTQVVRSLRRQTSPREWAAAGRAAGPALAALLREPAPRVAEPGGLAADGGARPWGVEAAFSLHDAVTTVLTALARRRPIVVVLEDLHRADASSLRLLAFAAQHAGLERLLLLGTYRDEQAEPRLSSLAAKAEAIALAGLDLPGVAELVTRVTGQAPEPEAAAEIHRRTGGNPFFIQQLAQLPQLGGAIPPGVRAAVRERLSLLPPGVGEALSAAAVLGHEFGARLLATMTGADPGRVERLLGRAVSGRLIAPVRGDRFAFAHDLVREVVYDLLPEEDRWRRHAAVVGAHRQAAPRGAARHVRLSPAELAWHAQSAGPALDVDEVVGWLVRAARDAAARMATEEAAEHARRALELAPSQDRRTRALILLDLGTILHHHGDPVAGQEAFEQAAETARRLGDDELLARAALALRRLEHPTRKPRLEVSLIEEAHRRLAPAGTATRLDQAVRDLSRQVAALARRREDDETLGLSLLTAHDAMLGPGTARDRLAIAGELAGLARRTADPELELHAARLRTWALLERGDPGYLDEHRAFVAAAERTGLPRFRFDAHWDQATVATLTGRFDRAATHIDRALMLDRLPHVNAVSVCRHLRWALDLRRGRPQHAAALPAWLDDGPHPYPHLVRAATALHGGDLASARRHLADDAAGAEGQGWYAPLRLRLQAETAAAGRDPGECERALAAIEPFADEWAVPGMATVEGPMAHWAALLHAALERWDEAIDGFTAAWHAADRLCARPWAVAARSRLADALLARGRTGDATAARSHLDLVESESAALGMAIASDRIRRSRSPSKMFSFDGTVWTLAYAGRTARVPDAKGMHDLRALLRQPGVHVSAVRLAGVADPAPGERAGAGCRDRLGRLAEEIARALRLGEDERAAGLDRERRRLVEELEARVRLSGAAAERARKTVSNRIRAALARLDTSHPELARHLRSSITTGADCRYQPVSNAIWEV